MTPFLHRLAPLLLSALLPLFLVACGGGGGRDFGPSGADGASGAGSPTGEGSAPPAISSQPASATIIEGQSATFSISASGDGLAYQWSRNGTPIAGATGSSYTVQAAQLSDSGASFTVTVSNRVGSVSSTAAALTVNLAPPAIANDVARTVSVQYQQNATFSVQASGSQLAFQWLRNGVPIAGANTSNYTLPGAGAADQGAVFAVVVSNAAGSVTSQTFTLNVTGTPVAPTIIVQPQPSSVTVGSGARFNVVVDGTTPLAYQWLRNDTPIAGANAASYTLGSTAQIDDQARFSVQITNIAGTVISASATLTVNPAPGISLLAGNIGGNGSLNGTGTNARFNLLFGVALDPAGNAYVTDRFNHVIRKVTPAGVVTTFAGSIGQTGTADGVGPAARFNTPVAITSDSAGNLYVTSNCAIREITPDATVTTLAGSSGNCGSVDGIGSAARFDYLVGITRDNGGNLYVTDTGNYTIRKITPAGAVTTLAGSAGQRGGVDGVGAAARFAGPLGIAVNSTGTVYVGDVNAIRTVAPDGTVTTVAGSLGVAGAFGTADGVGTAASFYDIWGLGIDSADVLYIADYANGMIRKMTPDATVTTLAGSLASRWRPMDGTGSAAGFGQPTGIAIDASGTAYVSDYDSMLRKVTADGTVTTLAGQAEVIGSADGAGAAATFSNPWGIAMDAAGNAYVADYYNSLIRKIAPDGTVTTLAGSAGNYGSSDGIGASASFEQPQYVAATAAGTVYVADNNVVRRITPDGTVTTLAGDPNTYGAADGVGAAATFSSLSGIAVDAAGSVYVNNSYGSSTIRKIAPDGTVTTVAGTDGTTGSADGVGASASFGALQGLAIDGSGNLYTADQGNNTIRRIAPDGTVTTVAGAAGAAGSVDGTGATARFDAPQGIATDSTGNLYVCDTLNGIVRKITPSGVVTTVAGAADGLTGVHLGALPGHLQAPNAVAVDARGVLYVTTQNGVVKIQLP